MGGGTPKVALLLCHVGVGEGEGEGGYGSPSPSETHLKYTRNGEM